MACTPLFVPCHEILGVRMAKPFRAGGLSQDYAVIADKRHGYVPKSDMLKHAIQYWPYDVCRTHDRLRALLREPTSNSSAMSSQEVVKEGTERYGGSPDNRTLHATNIIMPVIQWFPLATASPDALKAARRSHQ